MKKTDHHDKSSSIPKLSRSASMRYKGEKNYRYKQETFSTTAESPDLDELCSLRSFDSVSLASCDLTNGTTTPHAAGVHGKRFVLHCQHSHPTPEQYLTPTQRKNRQIKQLHAMLKKANLEVKARDEQIQKLAMDLDQLKLGRSENLLQDEEDARTPVQENSSDTTLQSGQPSPDDKQADSGILDDHGPTLDRATFHRLLNLYYSGGHGGEEVPLANACSLSSLNATATEYQAEFQQLKEKYNNKVETLLQSLSEANSRYMELQPLYERAQERVRMLEAQVDVLKQELKTQEERHSQMYLKMYKKGQEAAKFEHADEVLEFAHRAPKRVSVPELLQQLHRSEQELEAAKDLYRSEVMSRGSTASVASSSQPDYTLPFLKDAMFYFLTERDNQQHLRAIQNILGFNDKEREAVSKSLKYRRFLLPCHSSALSQPPCPG